MLYQDVRLLVTERLSSDSGVCGLLPPVLTISHWPHLLGPVSTAECRVSVRAGGRRAPGRVTRAEGDHHGWPGERGTEQGTDRRLLWHFPSWSEDSDAQLTPVRPDGETRSDTLA